MKRIHTPSPGFLIMGLPWIDDPVFANHPYLTKPLMRDMVEIITSQPPENDTFEDLMEYAADVIDHYSNGLDQQADEGFLDLVILLFDQYIATYKETWPSYEYDYRFYKWLNDTSLLLVRNDLEHSVYAENPHLTAYQPG